MRSGCATVSSSPRHCPSGALRRLPAPLSYDKEITALLVIDPYNDFISEGGFVWDRVKGVAEANNCVPHMREVLNSSRQAGLRVFYALHHRHRSGDYERWKYLAPVHSANWRSKICEDGTWRGEVRPEFRPDPGDVVAAEHWTSSGFANTDLDQQLKVLDINLPNYVHAIVTTSQITEAISSRPAADQVTGSRRSGSTR